MDINLPRPRVAVYGGSFNPIHNGHLELAQHILDYGLADSVMFMPTPFPAHKDKNMLASYEDRCNMILNAIESITHKSCHLDEPGIMTCSTLESRLPAPSYTLQTLDALSNEMLDKEFSWIIGADELNQLHTWEPEPVRLVRNYRFITFLRVGVSVDLTLLNHHWPGWLCRRLLDGVVFDAGITEISSSMIRNYIKDHLGVEEYTMPKKVFEYIQQHNLYGKNKHGQGGNNA